MAGESRSDGSTGEASSARPDRRKHRRHKIDDAAVVHLIDIAAVVHGRIVDVSLGGCRIRTKRRFPVGAFRRVEIEFCANGLPLRLGGVTQAIHDPINIGIRFLDVSERKREQLVELIEEVEELRREKAQD